MFFLRRMMCATDTGKDFCLGDDGGALVYQNTQVGIASFSNHCATPGYPGVYANVVNQRKWIQQVTGV